VATELWLGKGGVAETVAGAPGLEPESVADHAAVMKGLPVMSTLDRRRRCVCQSCSWFLAVTSTQYES
jgi:hypothetical protein